MYPRGLTSGAHFKWYIFSKSPPAPPVLLLLNAMYGVPPTPNTASTFSTDK